jgi:hypothetical protein
MLAFGCVRSLSQDPKLLNFPSGSDSETSKPGRTQTRDFHRTGPPLYEAIWYGLCVHSAERDELLNILWNVKQNLLIFLKPKSSVAQYACPWEKSMVGRFSRISPTVIEPGWLRQQDKTKFSRCVPKELDCRSKKLDPCDFASSCLPAPISSSSHLHDGNPKYHEGKGCQVPPRLFQTFAKTKASEQYLSQALRFENEYSGNQMWRSVVATNSMMRALVTKEKVPRLKLNYSLKASWGPFYWSASIQNNTCPACYMHAQDICMHEMRMLVAAVWRTSSIWCANLV